MSGPAAPQRPAAPRGFSARLLAAVLAAILLYTLGLAIGPRVSGEALEATTPSGARLNCLAAIDLPGPFGILLNCDSPGFMEAAADPGKLLEPRNVRQNRPGQVWLAWLIAQPLKASASAMVAFASRDDVGLPDGATRTRAQAITDLGPVFAAYYLINVAMLVAAVWLLCTAVGAAGYGAAAAACVGAALLFNDITKAYLLTPHSQLMNIVLPMVMVTLLFGWFRGAGWSVKQQTVLGAVTGACLLAYATWLLVPVCLIAALARSRLAGGTQWVRGRSAARWLPVFLVLAIVPYMLWYSHVMRTVGSFYQHEMTYDNGLVWLWQEPPAVALARLVGNVGYLLGAAAAQSLPLIVFIAPAAGVLWRQRRPLDAAERADLLRSIAAAAFVSLLFLGFFALLGFRLWRYAVPLLPAWALPIALLNAMALARLGDAPRRTVYLGVLVALGVAVGIAQVAKEGPWG